jgi:hypothetical protein
MWVWFPHPSGSFSVRLAHESLYTSSQIHHSLFSLVDWKCLRSLMIQHRLKHLIMKITWNILSSRPNIFRFANNIDLNLLNFLPQSVMAHPKDFSIAFLDALLLEQFGGIMFGLLKETGPYGSSLR